MARLNVNPTRMEMSRLKGRLITARRGHKLLKDKRDELMRQFLVTVQDSKKLRAKVEASLLKANKSFALASSVLDRDVLEEAMIYPKMELDFGVSEVNTMSVILPVYNCELGDTASPEIFPYAFADTPGELDEAVISIGKVLPDMIKLAQAEKSIQLMAGEIEKTRRRVNALEYVMIPQLEETIKFIQMKLDENERDSQTRVIKVKDMILAEAIEKRRLFEDMALDEYD